MKMVTLFVILLLWLFCYIDLETHEKSGAIKYNLSEITKKIEGFSTNEIYIIDMNSNSYRSVKLAGESVSNDNSHIDIVFWATDKGKRIAEIKINPLEEKMEVKYPFNECSMFLYDPSTRKSYRLLEYNHLEKWLEYEICINRINEIVEVEKCR